MRSSIPINTLRKKLFFLALVILILPVYAQPPCCRITISDQLELIRLTDNSWMHTSYIDMPPYGRVGANGLILVDGKEAFLFDTPWDDSLTCSLVNYLTDSMHLVIKGFIPNHWHEDCMGGLACLQSRGIVSYANQMTVDMARAKGLPVPEHGFKDSMELRLGNKLIHCCYLGAAHSTDNISVWLPSEKVLFAGCTVKSANAKNLGNTADGDLASYPLVLEKLILKFPEAEIIVPGHGSPGGSELLRHTLRLAEGK